MIDEYKLLSAFIYSAHRAGDCGRGERSSSLEDYLVDLQRFIGGEGKIPIKKIILFQRPLFGRVREYGIRKYIYELHYEQILSNLKNTFLFPLGDILKNETVAYKAKACCPNFYEVLETEGDKIQVRHLVLEKEISLKRMDGLEIPKKGDIVSSHWNYFLEVVDSKKLNEYLKLNKEYYSNFK